jgi:hypothetical protein
MPPRHSHTGNGDQQGQAAINFAPDVFGIMYGTNEHQQAQRNDEHALKDA